MTDVTLLMREEMDRLDNELIANIDSIISKANEGDAEAQHELARAYLAGTGVEQSNATALELLYKSAEQGNTEAMRHIGCIYDDFGGQKCDPTQPLEQDFDKAYEWYSKAAAQGNLLAQASISYMYLGGRGRPVDLEKAFSITLELAKKGEVIAMIGVATMYYDGVGVEQDKVKSYAWFSISNATSSPGSDFDERTAELSASELEEAKSLIEEYKQAIASHTGATVN